MKNNVHVGPFQTEILKERVAQAPAKDTHMMVAPIRCTVVVQGKACSLPPGLQVLHAYTMPTAGSKQVSIVVRNMTDSAIFLKRGAHVAHVTSAVMVPPEEVPSEEEQDTQESRECLSVQERQEKLFDKLNLDGLSEWSPRNAAIVRELLLSYHDTFALKSNELGCTSAIEHEIRLNDGEPFKEHFRCIPSPLLEEVCASLRDMLEAGAIWPSQSPWCNAMVLVWKKDGSSDFALISEDSMCGLRILTLSPGYKRCWRAWLELHTSPPWTSRVDFGRSAWLRSCSSILHSRSATWVFMSSQECPLDCVTCTCDIPASNVEHAGRVELDLLCHLPR